MITSLIVALVVAAPTPSSSAESPSPSWEALAKEYVEIEQSVRSGSRSSIEVYERWTDVGAALARASIPVPALRRGLDSPDTLDRKVALAAMGVGRVQDDDLFRSVVKLAAKSEDVEFREYAARALANMSPRQVSVFGDDLVEVFSTEKAGMVVVAARPVLAQLNRAQSLRLLSALAIPADAAMRRLVRALATQREDGFVDELVRVLQSHGAHDAAREMDAKDGTGASRRPSR